VVRCAWVKVSTTSRLDAPCIAAPST
jgi:hypothetical protein